MTNNRKNLKPKRWSARKKMEIVLRLFGGEPIDDVSRDVGVETFRLSEWREKALAGMEVLLKDRVNDPKDLELSRAKQQIGELSMKAELLEERIKKQGPLVLKRLK